MRLPTEILLECIDYAGKQPLNGYQPDYRCLRNLCLVSKQISLYAQKALFSSVFLFKNRHALAFGSALNPGSEKGRWLANVVLNLKAQVRNDRGGLQQQLFTAALLACPNLTSLELDIGTHDFDMSPFSTVFISRASPIVSLRIFAPSDTHTALHFLRVFPSLKFVEFRDICTPHPTPHPDGPTPACSLSELVWPGPLNESLLWALSSSADSLEILCIPSPILNPTHLDRLLTTHGHALRSLHIAALNSSNLPCLLHCTVLEEFIYDGVPTPELLAHLPPTLEHLQIQIHAADVYPSSIPHETLRTLKTFFDTAPSLLAFTCVHGCVQTFTELRYSCERRGILWRGWKRPYGRYGGERQPLGYVDTFPRPLTISPARAKDYERDEVLRTALCES